MRTRSSDRLLLLKSSGVCSARSQSISDTACASHSPHWFASPRPRPESAPTRNQSTRPRSSSCRRSRHHQCDGFAATRGRCARIDGDHHCGKYSASRARDIPGILRRVAGVTHCKDDERSRLRQRAGYNQAYSSRLLVLVDDRQVYADYYGFTPWGAIPVELRAIRHIEVVPGLSGKQYIDGRR